MFTTRSRFITSPGITGCLSIQQVPILPTFLEQLFCTKVFCAKADHKMLVKLTFYEQIVCFKVFCSFSIIAISIIVLFGKKNISAKVACKMLVKLTPSVLATRVALWERRSDLASEVAEAVTPSRLFTPTWSVVVSSRWISSCKTKLKLNFWSGNINLNAKMVMHCKKWEKNPRDEYI